MYGRFCITFPQNRMKGERHLNDENNVSGFNDTKFHVNTLLHSMLCIFTFAEMTFAIPAYGYGGSH